MPAMDVLFNRGEDTSTIVEWEGFLSIVRFEKYLESVGSWVDQMRLL